MENLVATLKALADANRLKILALLAQTPRSGDELAALLDLKPSTISHHLSRLQKVGLVGVTAVQYYHIYAVNESALAELRGGLTAEALMKEIEMIETIDNNAYRQQILDRWIAADRLQGLPTQIKQRDVILTWLAEKFIPDRRYSPRQVDDVLDAWCSWADPHRLDITSATRALVDDKRLRRTRDGGWFWRADSPLAAEGTNFSLEHLPLADTTALHTPLLASPLRALVQLAMRIKANQPFTATEIDELIQQHWKADDSEPAVIRATLIDEDLLIEHALDAYIRPTIGPDHPSTAKLRAEALDRFDRDEGL